MLEALNTIETVLSNSDILGPDVNRVRSTTLVERDVLIEHMVYHMVALVHSESFC